MIPPDPIPYNKILHIRGLKIDELRNQLRAEWIHKELNARRRFLLNSIVENKIVKK